MSDSEELWVALQTVAHMEFKALRLVSVICVCMCVCVCVCLCVW